MTWNVKSEDDNLMLGRTAYKCNLKWSNKSIAAFIAAPPLFINKRFALNKMFQ